MIDLSNITSITADSRQVKKGSLFFAIKGAKSDGHDYIEKAIAAGAKIIVGEKPFLQLHLLAYPELDSGSNNLSRNGGAGNWALNQVQDMRYLQGGIIYAQVSNIRRELALAAAAFYKTQPAKIAVITGTNGKTSTADFCRQFFEMAGQDAASIGTLGFIHNNAVQEFDNTSPDPVIMHEALAQVKDFAAIEGSSIGLEQHRLDGLKITAAGFTNFTQDHLDYHGSMEEYFRAKTLLFTRVMQNGIAVINTGLPKFDIGNNKLITFGNGGDLQITRQTPTPDGQEITVSLFGKTQDYKIGLVGKFQSENILCAIGLSFACGLRDFPIHKLKPIAGRMEQAAPGVYVDYAHTPDALENALSALRPHTHGKLHVVFGCGGDRDKGKRPLMGAIAAQLADNVIVTDDNPRTEKPEVIRAEILAACPAATEIADRAAAIKTAITNMQKGDILLIAGKGHEKYQIYGTEKQYFDDVAEVKSYN